MRHAICPVFSTKPSRLESADISLYIFAAAN
jgi:hypothetical protein